MYGRPLSRSQGRGSSGDRVGRSLGVGNQASYENRQYDSKRSVFHAQRCGRVVLAQPCNLATESAGCLARADEAVEAVPRLFCEVPSARSSGKGSRRGWEIQAVRDFPRNGGVWPDLPYVAPSNQQSVVPW